MALHLAGQEAQHSGPVVHQVVSLPGATATSIAAHNAAAYFLANMEAEVFPDDHAHATNVAAVGGVVAQASYQGAESDPTTAKFSNTQDLRPAALGDGMTIV